MCAYSVPIYRFGFRVVYVQCLVVIIIVLFGIAISDRFKI